MRWFCKGFFALLHLGPFVCALLCLRRFRLRAAPSPQLSGVECFQWRECNATGALLWQDFCESTMAPEVWAVRQGGRYKGGVLRPRLSRCQGPVAPPPLGRGIVSLIPPPFDSLLCCQKRHQAEPLLGMPRGTTP